MVQNQFGQATDNSEVFCFLNIWCFLCCWYLVEKKIIWKRKEISLLLLLTFLNPKISFFVGKGAGVCVCAERDLTQEGSSRE